MQESFEINGNLYEANEFAVLSYPLDRFEEDMRYGTSWYGYEENPGIQTRAGEESVWVNSPDLPYLILAEIDRQRNLIWILTARPE